MNELGERKDPREGESSVRIWIDRNSLNRIHEHVERVKQQGKKRISVNSVVRALIEQRFPPK